jgi:hypothetical protein
VGGNVSDPLLVPWVPAGTDYHAVLAPRFGLHSPESRVKERGSHAGLKMRAASENREVRTLNARSLAMVNATRTSITTGSSGIKAAEPAVRALLKANPEMPAIVVAEHVGWSGSPAWFRECVARIRPEYAPADPADRINYEPGDRVQGDPWFSEGRIPVGKWKLRVLPVMMSTHSRSITGPMIPSRL